MPRVRPDGLVKLLTALTSLAYFGLCVVGTLVLIGLPAAKAFGGADFHYGLELPVTAPFLEPAVQTALGIAPVNLGIVRAELQLPIPMLPWSLVAVLWVYTAASIVLILLFLHNLRRIFQRVRDGAAFDTQNAIRLRALSVALLALAVLQAVAEVATSIAVRSGLAAGSSIAVPRGFHVDTTLILVALVLMALAEVFRRGAELEEEQSLVI